MLQLKDKVVKLNFRNHNILFTRAHLKYEIERLKIKELKSSSRKKEGVPDLSGPIKVPESSPSKHTCLQDSWSFGPDTNRGERGRKISWIPTGLICLKRK